MGQVKEIINIARSRHTAGQKTNYLRYLLSVRSEVLKYDPINISIVATSACTLSCDMCPTHSSKVPKDYAFAQKAVKDMTFELFKEIVDRFDKALNVNIIGSGEPLLNKDFFRMVDYADSKRMKVKTFSNGTTIEENIGAILKSPLSGITISLNGQDVREFRRMTGMDEKVYDKIKRAIKKLTDHRSAEKSALKVKVSFIIDRHNYRRIPDMIDTAVSLGADGVLLCNFLSCPYDGFRAEERALFADDQTIAETRAIIDRCKPSVKAKVYFPKLLDMKSVRNRCDTHFTQIRFDGEGNASSCSMMLLNMEGRRSIKEPGLWNSAFFRNMRKAFMREGNNLLSEPCRVCPDNRGISCEGRAK